MITASVKRSIHATLLCLVMLARTLVAADNSAVQSLAVDNATFAFDLYSQLKATNGNLFFSPYSISTCLAMTYAGARGNTAKEIAATLHFNASPTALAEPFATLQQQLNSAMQTNGINLSIVNGLWAQAGHPFEPAFLQIAGKQFGARLEHADFLTNSETVRHEINDWVSQQTQGKIRDLFSKRALNAQTALVLVNAIYFKGSWTVPFRDSQTTNSPFALSHEQKISVPLMHVEGQFNYAENGDFQLLELPYTDGQSSKSANVAFSMVVVLPKNPDNLSALEVGLNASTFNTWLNSAQSKRVNVFLPRFILTQQFDLRDTLSLMGMTEAFSPRADFSGMDGDFDLSISAVVHKAFIDVNEQGTEAAAATGVTMHPTAVLAPSKLVFRADHPFLFLIRDKVSGSILFLGRLSDPRA